MTINIMNEYIDITKKQIETYFKIVFGNKFNKKFWTEYTDKYINIRYYNYDETTFEGTPRKKIIERLNQVKENLESQFILNRELIQQMCIFYYYILYFDNVVYYKDLKKTITKIAKLRQKLLNKKDDSFEDELYEKMSYFINQKQNFIDKFNSNEFYLKISNYPDKLNVYRVNLKNNIKFPKVYSEFAIKKAFERGTIEEDKLIIEYYLITIKILQDILKNNFIRSYIVEFAYSLLKKENKLKNLLNIISNPAVQDKICIKIRYENYLKFKDKIHDLMKNGYQIAIILDNTFEVNYKNIESLKLFKYVLLNKNLKQFEQIKEENIKNIIIL